MAGGGEKRKTELEGEEWSFGLVDEASQIGVRQIARAGGCPLAYSAIFDLVEYAVEKGLDQNLVTSGIISREQARRLAQMAK